MLAILSEGENVEGNADRKINTQWKTYTEKRAIYSKKAPLIPGILNRKRTRYLKEHNHVIRKHTAKDKMFMRKHTLENAKDTAKKHNYFPAILNRKRTRYLKYSPAITGENRLFTFYTLADISMPKK